MTSPGTPPATFEQVRLALEWIIAPSLIILTAAIGIALVLAYRGKRYLGMEHGAVWAGWTIVAVAALGAITLAITAIPYKPAYWQMYRATGEVLSVTNVLDSGSGELSTTPVMRLSGVDRPIAINDPRIVQLEGETVTFTCRMAWHYQAADTYSCAIYGIGDPA